MTKDYFSKLTPEEKHILKNKGTEAPFTGEYNEHFEAGIFICRACDNPLYESNTKFNSGCGLHLMMKLKEQLLIMKI